MDRDEWASGFRWGVLTGVVSAVDLLRREGRLRLDGRTTLADTYHEQARPYVNDHATLQILARAIREGRVTIQEAP